MARNELISLGLVATGPLHVYAINTMIKEMGLEDWAKASRASIYNSLARLERDGFVNVAVQQVGNTPPRKVYSITHSGWQRLHDEQLDALLSCAGHDSCFGVALTFLFGMPAHKAIELCTQRLSALDRQIEHLKHEMTVHKKEGIHSVVILLTSAIEYVQVEIKTTKRLIELLTKDPQYYAGLLTRLSEWAKSFAA